jgi:hypothetical protein
MDLTWELVGQLAVMWLVVSLIHPTINIHHTYDDPPEEEEGDNHVGFKHHKEK